MPMCTRGSDGAGTSQGGEDIPNPPPAPPSLADAIAVLLSACNIPDVTITKIWIMASSALHSILVKHTLMHQLKMSLIWLNVLRELKCVYLVY